MSEEAQFRLRVHFVKKGRLAYLSHLEVARALERAVRRADLPYAVTQGFSPHMRIAFGAALPVGVGGTDEIFDIFLREYLAPERALARLREKSPVDLAPFSAELISTREASVSVAFPFSTYSATLMAPCMLKDPAIPQTIEISRENKDTKVFRVEEYLHAFFVERVEADGAAPVGAACEAKEPTSYCAALSDRPEILRLRFVLEAKPTGSLRADVFLREVIRANDAWQTTKIDCITRTSQSAAFSGITV